MKISLTLLMTFSCTFVLVLFSGQPESVRADAYTTQTILIPAQCSQIGIWDASTKTCTMTKDWEYHGYNAAIRFQGSFYGWSDVTLDGNGHTLRGIGNGTGIALAEDGTTIKNMTITGFSKGVNIRDGNSRPNTLLNNIIETNSGEGIYIWWSSGNRVTNNIIRNNGGNGIYSYYQAFIQGNVVYGNQNGIEGHEGSDIRGNSCFDNRGAGVYVGKTGQIIGNDLSGNHSGIYLYYQASGVTIRGNTMQNNLYGLEFNYSGVWSYTPENITVYNNNFIDNSTQVYAGEIYTFHNVFHIAAPTGGNYWNDFDSAGEGCLDVNGDNFCDSPYSFNDGQDLLPLTSPVQSSKPMVILEKAGDAYWASYVSYTIRKLTIDLKVTNRGPGDAYMTTITDYTATNGVSLMDALPDGLWFKIDSGNSFVFTHNYNVPEGTNFFSITYDATTEDVTGVTYLRP